MNSADYLKGLGDKKILVIGDVMLDEYVNGEVTRISPEAPAPILDLVSRAVFPGGAANTASNVKSFDVDVHIIGVIGDDDAGKRLTTILKKKGINTDGLYTDTGRPTTLKTRIMSGNHQIVRVDEENREDISLELVKKIIAHASKLLPEIDAVIISDYNKGVINHKLLDKLIPVIKESGKPIVVDSKVKDYAGYRGVTVITPSKAELGAATGIRMINQTSLRNAALKALSQLECEAVLANLEKEGVYLFEKNGGLTHMPQKNREVYDVVGVRDAIVSVFTLALTKGASMKEAAKLAGCAAEVVSGKPGSSTITIDEIIENLK